MKKYIFPLAVIAAFASCETNVYIDLPEDPPQLVLNAVLDADEDNIKCLLSKSGQPGATDFELLTDYTFSFYENGVKQDVEVEEIQDTIWGYDPWTGEMVSEGVRVMHQGIDFQVKEGAEYTFELKTPDFPQARSVMKMPQSVPFTYTADKFELVEEYERYYTLTMENFKLILDDPAGENFYGIRLKTETNIEGLESTAAFIDANYDFEGDKEYQTLLLFDDKSFDGQKVSIPLTLNEYAFIQVEEGKSIALELFSFNSHCYEYIKSLERHENAEYDPFAQPSQIYSNVDGGMGAVVGMSKSKIELKAE